MEHIVADITRSFDTWQDSLSESDEFVKAAQRISCIALSTFTGELLDKALDISKALANFSAVLIVQESASNKATAPDPSGG